MPQSTPTTLGLSIVLGYLCIYVLWRMLPNRHTAIGGVAFLTWLLPGIPVLWLIGLLVWRGLRRFGKSSGVSTPPQEAES